MPCHVDPPSPSELRAADEYFTESVALFDSLTHSNDVLREWLIDPKSVSLKNVATVLAKPYKAEFTRISRLANRGAYAYPDPKYFKLASEAYALFQSLKAMDPDDLSSKDRMFIEKQQREHRVCDLKRLAKVAVDEWDMPLLKKIMDADPNAPLEAQLGFDPDSK